MRRRSSRVLIVGAGLVALGFGNWAMGTVKCEQYKAREELAISIGGAAVKEEFRGTASILSDRTEAHELYEDAHARYQYYKLVRRGGRFFMATGAVLIVAGLLGRAARATVDRSRKEARDVA